MIKIEKIKLSWREFRSAKQAEKPFLRAITSVASYPVGDDVEPSCVKSVDVVEGREPLIATFRCKDFNLHKECAKGDCPCANKNALFVEAHQKYIKARRAFIKEIFGRVK